MKAPFEACLQQQTSVVGATATCIHFKSINQFKSMHLKVLSLLVRKTTQIKLWSSLLYSIRAHICDLPHLVELGTSIQEIATVKRISSECLKITYPDVQVSG